VRQIPVFRILICVALQGRIDEASCDTIARRANHLNPVQPSREKFSAFDSRQITFMSQPSRPTRGAARDRHETRDGMRWTRGHG
jgi:hypothetical protein